jgi:tetratricopeptide (TPR) repeat protein
LAFGGYITEIIDQPLTCPVGIDCSVESAFESLSPLLRDSNPLRSDARLVLAVASLRQAAAVERAERASSPAGAKSPSDPAGAQNSKAESYWLAQAYQYCDQTRKEDPILVWPHIICGLAQYRQTLQPQCAATADTARAQLSGTFKAATARALLSGTFKALFPNLEADAGLHAGFGDLLLEMQCFDEAEQQYEAAIRLNPRNSYSMVGLGTIARRNIRLGEAAYHYAEALTVNPVEPYANGGLGATLYDQNNANVADAIPHLDRALAFDPTYEVAVQACKKIDMAQNAQRCTLRGDRAVQ